MRTLLNTWRWWRWFISKPEPVRPHPSILVEEYLSREPLDAPDPADLEDVEALEKWLDRGW